MASQLVPVAALLMGSALLLVAGGLHGLLLPIRGSIEGFTTAELGLIGTGWAVGFVAGCLIVPRIVRRVGHVRAYGVMASIASVVILLNLLYVSPFAWITLRAFSGFCFAGAAMIVESWLNERATRENRGTIFSVYQMVNFAASTAGQLLITTGSTEGYEFFVLGAIFYSLAILPSALSTAQTPRPLKTTKLDLRRLFVNSPVSAVGCFIIGMVNGAFGTLGAVYAQKIGLPTSAIALVMSGAVLGGALTQVPLGRLSDRIDRRYVLIGVSFAAIIMSGTISLLNPSSAFVVIALVAGFGGMVYPMYGLAVAHANDYAAPDDFVKIASGLLLMSGIGTMIGPIVAALAMEWVGPQGLFTFCGLMHASLIAYIFYRLSRRPAVADVPRDAFQSMPPLRDATPETIALDPRASEGKQASA
ncbi:Major Facilitator Superfamily protein [Kaistia soli DSM 19436]|uniref:Major Facilitator Superfamily protein n=1 Tax=Kaistia soli DSM 19436 TaxID=1122133 RepID=A0A1M5AEW6_9HYPH|nr:MFS transporter [Kaistia soli]SHF28704.1 Major Facilitator Superfamily protein [Kaistia soli DSM 19436]